VHCNYATTRPSRRFIKHTSWYLSKSSTCQRHQPLRRLQAHPSASFHLTGYPVLSAHTALADVTPCLSRHPRITKTWSSEWKSQAEHGLRLNDLHCIAAQPRPSPIAFARLAAIGHVEGQLQQAWHKLVRGRRSRPCPRPRVSTQPCPV
jgi:hypothetical protein